MNYWNERATSQLYVDSEPSHEKFQEWLSIGRNELPLVWQHQSRRKSRVIGNSAVNVLGMDSLAGLELLHLLRDWATQERFHYSHEWSVGDTVMWDNTGHCTVRLPIHSTAVVFYTVPNSKNRFASDIIIDAAGDNY